MCVCVRTCVCACVCMCVHVCVLLTNCGCIPAGIYDSTPDEIAGSGCFSCLPAPSWCLLLLPQLSGDHARPTLLLARGVFFEDCGRNGAHSSADSPSGTLGKKTLNFL